MSSDFDIAIVGAGAAGLAAGIFAAQTRPHLRIGLCDGARAIGAKILVSGGGRCNVTNERVTASDFHAPRRIVERILRRFDEHDTVGWFESMGVRLKLEPTGKLFPDTNKARTVLETLVRRCHELGVMLMTQHRVKKIAPTPNGFQIFHEEGHVNARQVIMATGGQSLPKSGSDGHGWSMVRKLG
ncbi:MAG: NAD(P)/FAD-dependent oxidoreductase, partial [Nitrospirales bacterium]|nr:NAD(P)/FAD-dependent oxidoreductase [Nitrospirales bacterium]